MTLPESDINPELRAALERLVHLWRCRVDSGGEPVDVELTDDQLLRLRDIRMSDAARALTVAEWVAAFGDNPQEPA